jgi:DNA-binding beta-propeller fold protein YncE
MKSFSADPSGTLLAAISLLSPSPEAQIVNVQTGGVLSPGPVIQLPGNSEGSAVLNGRVAIVDSDHNKVNLYEVSGGGVNLISSADTDGEPHWVIFDSTGKHLYVANCTGGTISVFSVSTGGELQLQQTVPVMYSLFGPYASPTQIRLNSAGTTLVGIAMDSIFVWSVKSSDGTLVAPVHNFYEGTLSMSFRDFTFDPTGNFVYVVESTNNLIYSFLASDSGLTLLSSSPFTPAGQATGIATNASGDRVYVLEMLAQVEAFRVGTDKGQLISQELLPVDTLTLPGQILRVQAR